MSPFVQVVWPVAATEYPGIASITQSSDTVTADWRFGWEFTVGASAIDIVALRVFAKSTATQRVRIHRVSDGVLMATADITGIIDTWNGAAITPVELAASTNYVVSNRRSDGANDDHVRNPTSITYASQITFVQGRFVGSSTDAWPESTSIHQYSNCDFRFTV